MSKLFLSPGMSSGIGKELADRFAMGGYDLVLVAHSEGKLLELSKEYRKKYGIKATVISKDVASHGVSEEIATGNCGSSSIRELQRNARITLVSESRVAHTMLF